MAQIDFTLGVTVNSGDNRFFFLGEVGVAGQDGDAVTVIPLSGGAPVSTWSLTINASDYGAQSGLWDTNNQTPDIGGRLTTFDLSDFSGGSCTLTGVDGVRLVDNIGGVSFDANVVGTAVPEPSSIMLCGIGICAAFGTCVRRRKLVSFPFFRK